MPRERFGQRGRAANSFGEQDQRQNGDDGVKQPDPQQQLEHGPARHEGVLGVDGLGDGFEGVGVAGDAEEVRGDKAQDGELGCVAVGSLKS